MKNLRKIALLALFLIMMGLIFTKSVCNAEIDDVKGKIKVEDISGKIGENVSVKVLVEEDMEIDNDGLLLEFNKSGLKYVSSKVATITNAVIMGGNRENHVSGPDGFSIAITSSVEGKVKIPKGTELANVTFTVLEGDRKEEKLVLAHYKGNTKTVLSEGKVLIAEKGEEPAPTPTPSEKPNPSATPSPSPSSSPSATPTPSPAPTQAPSPSPSGNPGSNLGQNSGNKPASLPKTGSGNILMIAIIASILVINMIVSFAMYRKVK